MILQASGKGIYSRHHLPHILTSSQEAISNGSNVLPPFQIIGLLTFLTRSLTTRLIQKICTNIVIFEELVFIKQVTVKEILFCTNF